MALALGTEAGSEFAACHESGLRIIPCDARILANQRTGGTFQALTGRVTVTEGMAPYLRPAMLDDVMNILLDARAFFQLPEAESGILAKIRHRLRPGRKENYLLDKRPKLILTPDPAKLAFVPGLDLVFKSPLMDVYRVETALRSNRPNPEDHPGYECRQRPLPTHHGPVPN